MADKKGRAIVTGTVFVRDGGSAGKGRKFSAVVSKGEVISVISFDKEIKDRAIIKSLLLRRTGDGTEHVALVESKTGFEIVLLRRNGDHRLVSQKRLASTQKGGGPAGDLFLAAVAPAQNGDFFVFAHGHYKGVLGQTYWRFNRAGKALWRRGWTVGQIIAKEGGFRVGYAAEHKNGQVLVFHKKTITRLAPGGELIQTLDIKEGLSNHRIGQMFRRSDGGIVLYGRYFLADGTSNYWLVDLGAWPD